MASTNPTVLAAPPSGLSGLLRLALPSVPGVNQLPGVRKHRGFTPLTFALEAAPVDQHHVEAYARVCGFPVKDTLPVTYPHLLGFGLQSAVMSSPAFPWPAIGLVHLDNAITQHRPIGTRESLAVAVELAQPRTHPKGTLLDFVTRVHSGEELVWESTSTYLRRGPSQPGQPHAEREETAPAPAAATLPWRLPADLGRQYAAVSGDHNPIHLYPLTAKALGFPRQIAHGMWSKARCLAAIENRLPAALTAQVSFRKPILLPSTVGWSNQTLGDTQHFRLLRKDGAEHLVGSVRPA
jgi:hypothetical protein